MVLSSTTSAAEITDSSVVVSERVTVLNNAVSEAKLVSASAPSDGAMELNHASNGDSIINGRQCPTGSSKPCVVKCCPLGESIGTSKVCEPTTLRFQIEIFLRRNSYNSTDDGEGYNYIIGNPCKYGR
jgi:hypothetical protein